MSRVILKIENDSVVVIVPTSIDNEKDILKSCIDCSTIESSRLQKDRIFRNAWNINGSVNIEKAKEIWKNKIRTTRDKRLQELDIKWMKALERGEIKLASSIASDKQTLRDMPDREELQNCKTVDEIKAFWPDILKG